MKKELHIMDISTLKEYRELKEIAKRLMAISSIIIGITELYGTTIISLHNVTYYVFLVGAINARAPSTIVWLLYGMIFLRKYYPYQYLFLLLPLFVISDALWNVANIISMPCGIAGKLTHDVLIFVVTLVSAASLAVIIFRPKFSWPNKYQFIYFFTFYIIYIGLGTPIILNYCTFTSNPNNWTWEVIWQIAFLLGFGTILTQKVKRMKEKEYVKWLFGVKYEEINTTR